MLTTSTIGINPQGTAIILTKNAVVLASVDMAGALRVTDTALIGGLPGKRVPHGAMSSIITRGPIHLNKDRSIPQETVLMTALAGASVARK